MLPSLDGVRLPTLAVLAADMVNNMAQEWWSNDKTVQPAGVVSSGVEIPKAPDKPREAPSGYRWVNGNLEPIPGGPADPNAPKTSDTKPTESQQKTLTLLTRIAGGTSDIQKTLAIDPEAQQAGLVETLSRNVLGEGVVTRSIAGPERRMVTDAQADILDALLTLGTGAAYSREQLIGQTISYFPQYGDTPAEITAKNDRLQRLTEAARIAAGPLADKFDETIKPLFGAVPTPPPVPAGAAGPAVTVSPEESIATFGQVTYDAQGNIVGRAYQQTGGTIYDAQGNELGLAGAVTEEQLQQPAPSFLGGIVSDIGESITGSERATPTTEALPDWTNMPEMQQLFSLPAFQASLGTMFGGGPQEIAQIVQSNFPGTQVFQDEKGNYILQSPSTGQRYAIKPGFQVSDIPRAIGTVLAGGGIQGGVRGAMAVGGREAAAQALIEGTQKAVGGTFNPEDIAMAGVGGGVLQKAGEVLPAAAGRVVGTMRRGTAPAPVIPQGAPELPGGIIRPGGGVTPPPAPVAPAAPSVAPVASAGAVDDVTVAPRMFEAGEAVTSRAGGAMGTSPEAVRLMQAEGLPVPIEMTRGAATRDPEQLAFEKEQIFSSLGGPLRKRAEENNLQALQNFDRFIDMTGAEAPDIAATGNAVIKALSQGYQASKNRVRAAYTRAEKAGETSELVPYATLVDYINQQTPTTRTSLAPILQSTLEKLRMEDPQGTGMISIRALEDVRKAVNKAVQPGTPNATYGSAIKDMIDTVTEGVGGDLYKEARRLRIEQGDKFEKRAIVARLVSNIKNMDDRRIPADRVFQSAILNESPENIRFLRSTLRDLGDDGKQAWGELQAATLRHLQERATGNVNLTSENLPVISAAQLNKAVSELDKNGRLDLIFNPKMAQQVRDLRDVIQYVNTVPPGTSINNSGTARTLAAMMVEMGATFTGTGIPLPVITGIKLIRDQVKDAKIKKQINRSLLPRGERD